MSQQAPLTNRVAKSNLITIDLAAFGPKEPIVPFDLKDFLVQKLVLMEKNFREAIAQHNWHQYKGKPVTVFCSVEAIIPFWAYMIVASNLSPHTSRIFYGNVESYTTYLYLENMKTIDVQKYIGQRIVIKGCGQQPIPETAFVEITRLLRPVAKSIMYGEPCSTVPIYKQENK